jgi:UDP-N-acetylmuramoyl-tripeptide--D-alanyl-D-alanine ligase
LKVSYRSTIGEMTDACGGSLIYGKPERPVGTITTDSRDLGEDNLFIPIVGEKHDGHNYIELLVKEKKLSGYLTMREELKALAMKFDSSCILCDDTVEAFGRIALRHRELVDPIVIGITGTNGKTTTKELISSVLGQKYGCLKNEKNYNNEVGVPYTLLSLGENHHMAVIELGMNHFGELERLSKISRPDVALITNIGEGHLEFLGSVENVALAKSEIMHGMKRGSLLFLNRETQCFDILQNKAIGMGLKVKTFGLKEDSDIHPDGYRLDRHYLDIVFRGEEYRLPLYGMHNVYNGISALAVGLEFGVPGEQIREAFAGFKNVDMRSQIFERDFIVINDTYNSNPLSSRYALLSAARVFPQKRKIAVLSDMKELGEFSEMYHRELGKEVFQYGFNLLFTWGEMSEHIARGAESAGMDKKNIFHFKMKDELVDSLRRNIITDDLILIKGSRSMKMEEVVDAVIH